MFTPPFFGLSVVELCVNETEETSQVVADLTQLVQLRSAMTARLLKLAEAADESLSEEAAQFVYERIMRDYFGEVCLALHVVIGEMTTALARYDSVSPDDDTESFSFTRSHN